MSYFYGYLMGDKKSVSRSGTVKSGITNTLMSNENKVVTRLISKEGKDYLVVSINGNVVIQGFIKINESSNNAILEFAEGKRW